MKKSVFFVLVLLSNGYSFACTTFLLNKNGQLLFGRNYDWITGAGIVNTNQRGLFKTSAEEVQQKASWVSLYGSITFNQYGKEFPTGGMNEKGLVVELMWLDGTEYSTTDERPAIGVLQWLQYQLDLHATVDEVIESDKKIRIDTRATPLHFLVADAKGNAATIEFLNGKMVVHKGDDLPFPVLANETYNESIKEADKFFKTEELPKGNSHERFSKACSMLKELQTLNTREPLSDYAFTILNNVSQGDYTKWSIVYDISNKKVLFKTHDFKTIKSFSFSAFDFACTTLPKMYDMNQPGEGDISSNFILPDKKITTAAIHKAASESKKYVAISEAEKKLLLEYADSVKCQ
ncbi:MAG: linear amide C-N hydrolase [Sphingobacteriales bacterium]|nr:MAG: linear amide C-N hydrolase [Sphingobacteriales bacterium]